MRQHMVEHGGVTVIEDCYNANPDSMAAALAMFREYPCQRRYALLGDMLELGDTSRASHEQLGALAAACGLDGLVTYGSEAKRTAVVAAAKGVQTVHAATHAEAAEFWRNGCAPGMQCWSRPAGAWRWKRRWRCFTHSPERASGSLHLECEKFLVPFFQGEQSRSIVL